MIIYSEYIQNVIFSTNACCHVVVVVVVVEVLHFVVLCSAVCVAGHCDGCKNSAGNVASERFSPQHLLDPVFVMHTTVSKPPTIWLNQARATGLLRVQLCSFTQGESFGHGDSWLWQRIVGVEHLLLRTPTHPFFVVDIFSFFSLRRHCLCVCWLKHTKRGRKLWTSITYHPLTTRVLWLMSTP